MCLVLCVVLGAFYGTLCLVASVLPLIPPVPLVVLGAVFGAAVGLICSVVFVPLLWKKQRLQTAVKWLLIAVSPIALLSGWWWSSSRSLVALVLCAPPACVLVFVGACLVLNRTLKDKQPSGHCQECGYNLTGNVSGVCPECGTEVKNP
jgi:hypothetical protein